MKLRGGRTVGIQRGLRDVAKKEDGPGQEDSIGIPSERVDVQNQFVVEMSLRSGIGRKRRLCGRRNREFDEIKRYQQLWKTY